VGSREETGAGVQHEITFADDLSDVVIATTGETNLPGFRAFVEELLASTNYRPGLVS
jgi:hypothetical protein